MFTCLQLNWTCLRGIDHVYMELIMFTRNWPCLHGINHVYIELIMVTWNWSYLHGIDHVYTEFIMFAWNRSCLHGIDHGYMELIMFAWNRSRLHACSWICHACMLTVEFLDVIKNQDSKFWWIFITFYVDSLKFTVWIWWTFWICKYVSDRQGKSVEPSPRAFAILIKYTNNTNIIKYDEIISKYALDLK